MNIALAKLRRGLSAEAVDNLLAATARKVISSSVSTFSIIPDVTAPENIPDNQGKPTLALVALKEEAVNVEQFITTAGPSRVRVEQNLVFLLIPDTVETSGRLRQQDLSLESTSNTAKESLVRLNDLARTVLAMRQLKKNPENFGIRPQKLEADDFKKRHNERELALESTVTESYRNLWYPSANGQIVSKEIRTSGGEGGTPVVEQIRKTLMESK